jgi:hypothetical protein
MRQKLALCVGINDYPGVAADLSGCVNDAHDWHLTLLERGYEVRMLLDSAATKANITKAILEQLVHLKEGDRFVFTFSGHGTWVPDKDGDESDRRDEALCCFDYANGGLLLDDEMHHMFRERAFGSRVTVLSDSCHSGTVSRFVIDPDAPTPRFISPTLISDISEEEARLREGVQTVNKPRSESVLVSGCDDHEFSYDATFDGRPNGAMTYFLRKALAEAPSQKAEDVYAHLRTLLPTEQYPQTPQLTATAYQLKSSLL